MDKDEWQRIPSPPTPPHPPPKNLQAATHRLKAYALKKYRRKLRLSYDETLNSSSVEIDDDQVDFNESLDDVGVSELQQLEEEGNSEREMESKFRYKQGENEDENLKDNSESGETMVEEETDKDSLKTDHVISNEENITKNTPETNISLSDDVIEVAMKTSLDIEDKNKTSEKDQGAKDFSKTEKDFETKSVDAEQDVESESLYGKDMTSESRDDVTMICSDTENVKEGKNEEDETISDMKLLSGAIDVSNKTQFFDVKMTSKDVDDVKVMSQDSDDVKVTSQEVDDVQMTSQEVDDVQMTSQEVDDVQITSQDSDDVQMMSQDSDDVQMMSQDSDDVKVTSQEVDDLKMTSQEVDDVKMTSQEEDDVKVTSQEVDDIKMTSQEEYDVKVTSQEVDDVKMTSHKVEQVKSRNIDNVQDTADDVTTFSKDEKNRSSTSNLSAVETPDDKSTSLAASVEEQKIPNDFFYKSEEYKSSARVSEDSGIPANLLQFTTSLGYDCCKRANLYLLKGPTLLFAAGSMVHLLNVKEDSHTYIRTFSGGGIGALAVHPKGNFFAVAEKGNKPNIMIYKFPSLKLYRILQGGTEKAYSSIDFSPKGNLLASVGSAPDYMLTVWSWKQEAVMLRSKAFSQEVYRVTFSPEQEGELTSCGTSHIRFWKMAWTFTGLKLKGDLGRFGKTALTDIEGYIQLPDGKVLSGTDWGNILLWDGGLIEMEIRRKNGKPCHVGAVQQLHLDEGELITIGTDGYIRVWETEAIDSADISDESSIFEIEPMNEMKVGNGVHLLSIVKCTRDKDDQIEAGTSIWFAQDANGIIWKLDLSFSHTTKAPVKMFSFIAGPITALEVSSNQQLIAYTGDSTVRIHDYQDKKFVCSYKSPNFQSKGTALKWPSNLEDGNSIVVGFSDGVLRVLRFGVNKKNQKVLNLIQAMKPHSNDITAIAFDSSAEIMATGSKDRSVFLFATQNDDVMLRTIGFVPVDGSVTSLQFSPGHFRKKCLLVGLDSGKVVEITIPDEKKINTSSSYLLNDVDMRFFSLKCVKPILRREEEKKRREIKKLERLEERKKDLQKMLDAGEEMSEEEQDAFLANDPLEEDDLDSKELEFPSQPSAVLIANYLSEDTFFLSMDDFDAGYLYKCRFDPSTSASSPPENPVETFTVDDSDDVPITYLRHTSDGKNVLVGFKNGLLRVYPESSSKNFELSSLKTYWEMRMHDNNYGKITSICDDVDNRKIFTAGCDGNLFIYDFLSSDEVSEAMKKAEAKFIQTSEISDIEDLNACNIQEAKLREEQDRVKSEADARKKEKRQELEMLRKDFLKLIELNGQLPAAVRLKHEDFELDPSLRKEIDNETVKKEDRLRMEMQWERAKNALQLQKLKKAFSAHVESDLVILHSIKSEHTVSNYRVAKLSKKIIDKLKNFEDFHNCLSKIDISADKVLSGVLTNLNNLSEQMDEESYLTKRGRNKSLLQGRQAELVAKALKKADDMKQKKLQRQLQWNALYKSKPDDNYDDPKDVAAIKEAQANMGDYKLKSADDYIVPEHLRIDTRKKIYQKLKLERLIYLKKSEFNRKITELRDRKQDIISSVHEDLHEIERLQKILDPSEVFPLPVAPKMHPDELPNRIFEYDQEILLKFEEEQKRRELEEETSKNENSLLGQFNEQANGSNQSVNDSKYKTRIRREDKNQTETNKPEEPLSLSLTDMEIQLRHRDVIKARHQVKQLLKSIEKKIQTFDAHLMMLRFDKAKLDVQVKMANLREVTLLEELILLKEYELREVTLLNKVSTKRNELNETNQKSVDTLNRYEMKKKEVDRLLDREKALHTSFVASLGDNNKFADFLTKVFKKKIKRSKKKMQMNSGAEDEDSEESSDESEWSSDEDEDDSFDGIFDDSVCPPGCDQVGTLLSSMEVLIQDFDLQTLYNSTISLREKKLYLEELIADEKKSGEQLKKDHESLLKKLKVMESQLNAAENDHEAFQVEKQGKLNQLQIVVPLRLHQIENVVSLQMSLDLTRSLVFESSDLKKLSNRIKELNLEKKQQRQLYKDARHKYAQLIKNRKVMEERIVELSDKCEQLMMLKFGRIVNLDKLDNVTINRNVVEMKEKIRLQGLKNDSELQRQKRSNYKLKEEIIEVTKENTKRLLKLNLLINDKDNLEKDLDERQTQVVFDEGVVSEELIQEQERLMQLVQLQSQEIQSLKDEISLLSRKGGYILPPNQPPLAQEQEAV